MLLRTLLVKWRLAVRIPLGSLHILARNPATMDYIYSIVYRVIICAREHAWDDLWGWY
jgi:hypothetical protein